MEKKQYTTPKLIPIGDMVNNTLGSSGTGSDAGTYQANYGRSQNTNSANRGSGRGSFDDRAFDNSLFDR